MEPSQKMNDETKNSTPVDAATGIHWPLACKILIRVFNEINFDVPLACVRNSPHQESLKKILQGEATPICIRMHINIPWEKALENGRLLNDEKMEAAQQLATSIVENPDNFSYSLGNRPLVLGDLDFKYIPNELKVDWVKLQSFKTNPHQDFVVIKCHYKGLAKIKKEVPSINWHDYECHDYWTDSNLPNRGSVNFFSALKEYISNPDDYYLNDTFHFIAKKPKNYAEVGKILYANLQNLFLTAPYYGISFLKYLVDDPQKREILFCEYALHLPELSKRKYLMTNCNGIMPRMGSQSWIHAATLMNSSGIRLRISSPMGENAFCDAIWQNLKDILMILKDVENEIAQLHLNPDQKLSIHKEYPDKKKVSFCCPLSLIIDYNSEKMKLQKMLDEIREMEHYVAALIETFQKHLMQAIQDRIQKLENTPPYCNHPRSFTYKEAYIQCLAEAITKKIQLDPTSFVDSSQNYIKATANFFLTGSY